MPDVERLAMLVNGTQANGSTTGEHALHRRPWVTTTLSCFLIFTIVVDILGNLLVIFSVYRNKKLRNAGELSDARAQSRNGVLLFHQWRSNARAHTHTHTSHLEHRQDSSERKEKRCSM